MKTIKCSAARCGTGLNGGGVRSGVQSGRIVAAILHAPWSDQSAIVEPVKRPRRDRDQVRASLKRAIKHMEKWGKGQTVSDLKALEAGFKERAIRSRPRPLPSKKARARQISVGMRTRVMERDGFRCRRCGVIPDGRRESQLVIDHILAVANGGSGRIENLQTLCFLCNAGKRDNEPHAHDRREFTG